MKTGNKASVRIGGTIYTGTVKRAFVSRLGIPSVWIEWPKGIDPSRRARSLTSAIWNGQIPSMAINRITLGQEPEQCASTPAPARPGYDTSRFD